MNVQAAIKAPQRRTKTQRNMDNNLVRVLHILERAANANATCPTNPEIADMLGLNSPSRSSGLIALLETAGFITVERGHAARVVTIVKSGKRTFGTVVKERGGNWSDDEDAILMDAIAADLTFGAASKHLPNRTERACYRRFEHLAAQLGDQAR